MHDNPLYAALRCINFNAVNHCAVKYEHPGDGGASAIGTNRCSLQSIPHAQLGGKYKA